MHKASGMKDDSRTKEQLLKELDRANRLITELKNAVSQLHHSQEVLHQREEMYRLHYFLANDVLFSYDHEFRLNSISPNVERLLGYKPEELVGRTFPELGVLDPADLDDALDDALHVLAGGVIYASVYQFVARDGTKKIGEVSGVPYKRDSRIIGVISVARDITERMLMGEELDRYRDHLRAQDREHSAELHTANEVLKMEVEERRQVEGELRRNEEKFNLHFSLSNDVMFSWDNQLKITYVSPNVERILGYRPEELVGRHIHEVDILDPSDLDEAMENAMNLLSGKKVYSSIYRFIAKDGTRLFGELSEVPILRNGKVVEIISVARDVTDRFVVRDSRG